MLYQLFNKKVFHIEVGLDRIKKACNEIGNPQNNFKSVLISGTNGKGSTAAFLENLFRNHSFKTGMFTSPHLINENERWQINRKEIPTDRLNEYIFELKPVIEKFNLTYFEASTLIAFKYFSDEKVDIAVLEVGLGGRWDSTNVVEPEISVITNVSLDHTQLLGETIEKIAFEKVGIGRENKPLIVGSDQKEILKEAKKKNIKEIYKFGKDFYFKEKDKFKIDYLFKNFQLEDLKISLLGKRQFNNFSTALTAFLVFCEKNEFSLDIEAIYNSASTTQWKGRMEIIDENPLIILDGAHNQDAIKKSFEELKELFPEKEIITIYSGMKDKDVKKIIEIIKSNSKDIIFTKIPVSRGLEKEDFKKFGNYKFIPEIESALETAILEGNKESLIFITGSLYLAGEVLKIRDLFNKV
jgi:dihydrofolate synthase/folylpolyglutamate synthase